MDLDGPVRILKNTAVRGRSWIAIEPKPASGGRTVIGTRVRVTSGGRTQSETYRVSTSYASGSLVPLHFGLGDAGAAERVEVRWPWGETQTFENVPGRKAYALAPGEALHAPGTGSASVPR